MENVGISKVIRFFFFTFFSVLLIGFLFYAFYAIKAVSFPDQLDYGEAQIAEQALRLGRGENIYRKDISNPPYTISNYPPVFLSLLVPFQKAFGPNLWSGRLISIISTLIASLFIGLIIYELSHNHLSALVAGGLFLIFPTIVFWSLLARIDMTAIMFSLAGLWVFIRWPNQTRALVVCSILFVLSVYTRQSNGLAAPGAIVVYLLIKRNWRSAALLVLLYGSLGLSLFFILNQITKGGFYFHIIRSNMSPWRDSSLVIGYFFLFLLMAVFLIYLQSSRKWIQQWILLILYLLLGLFTATLIGKVGSNLNYLNEFVVGMSFLLGILVTISGGNIKKQLLTWMILIPLVSWYVYFGKGLVMPLLEDRLSPNFQAGYAELRSLVRSTQGDIVIDEYMGVLIQENKPIYIQLFDMTQLSRLGLWDQRTFLKEIENKNFPYIIMTVASPEILNDRWTPEMLQAVDQNYYVFKQLNQTLIYKPNP